MANKISFILGIMFGLGLHFFSSFFMDLIFLLKFPNEGIVPNAWGLGLGIICCVGSFLVNHFLPEHDEILGADE